MLGYFPILEDDEMLYSGYATFHDRLAPISAQVTRLVLNGTTYRTSMEVFPNRLDHLASQLPTQFGISGDTLMQKHTFYPFVAPFLTRDAALLLAEEMKSNNPQTHAGAMGSSVALSRHLRYCVLCAEVERRELHGAYWHRLHQIAAVKVCPVHSIFLEDSNILRGVATKSFFYSAETSIPKEKAPIKVVNPSDPWHRLLLWVGEQCDWLLRHPEFRVDREQLQRFYRQKIWSAGYARPGTNLNGGFVRAFENSFSFEWLADLGCAPRSEHMRNAWIKRAIKGIGKPIQHLLIMRTLGVDVQALATYTQSEILFESGPWYCTNPECEFWYKRVVQGCEISCKECGLVEGIFECSKCGNRYKRIGPDPNGTFWDRRRRYRIGNLGKKQQDPKMKTVYREKVRSFIVAHPQLTRTELNRQFLKLELSWLRYYGDHKFLEEVLPKRKRSQSVPGNSVRDWAPRDSELASIVPGIRKQLLSASIRPRRVSRTSIIVQLGFRGGLLPKQFVQTNLAVDRATESDESFALRRMLWLASHEGWTKQSRTVYQILKRAEIRPEWKKTAWFQKALTQVKILLGIQPHSGVSLRQVRMKKAA